MTIPTDPKALAELTRETHNLMHWQSDDFNTCEDEECKLARAVLALDEESQRLAFLLERLTNYLKPIDDEIQRLRQANARLLHERTQAYNELTVLKLEAKRAK